MRTLVIDCNALCHKAKHSVELTYETMDVGIIFGFLGQLLKLAKTYESNKFAFTWDSDSSHRLKLFPGYKEGRRTQKSTKTDEEKIFDKAAYAQFDILYEQVLPELGFKNNFKIKGFEGDDLIASIVDCSEEPMLIVSGDEDMYQCIHEDVAIVNAKGLYTISDFRKEFGIEPHRWAEVKSIAGCPTDEVPGIKGVGTKKAIQYLLGEMNPKTDTYRKIVSQEGREIFKRNKKLVTLPFAYCPDIELKPDKLSFEGFLNVCERYEFRYYLRKENLQKWKDHIFLQRKLI